MDFVVATIPTMLALEESARLVAALRAEDVPVSTMVVNQVVGEGMGGTYLGMKLKEQEAALRMLDASPHLAPLEIVRGRQLDLEVRGLPALQYVAGVVWAGMPLPAGGAGEGLVRASALLLWLSCVERDRVRLSEVRRETSTQRSRPPFVSLDPWCQRSCAVATLST